MRIGNITVEPWNRKNTPWRILALLLVGAWVAWGVIIFQEGKEINARIQAQQQEKLSRQAIERRKAAFEQEVQEERKVQTGSQNIIDSLPGGQL